MVERRSFILHIKLGRTLQRTQPASIRPINWLNIVQENSRHLLKEMWNTNKLPGAGENHHHRHKHQGLGHLARSVFRVTAALASVSSVSRLFSFLMGENMGP
jgi:hypothetical protein